MSDPYKRFKFNVPKVGGGTTEVEKSTAELMSIEQSGYLNARQEIGNILSILEGAGIVSTSNPWEGEGAARLPNGYAHLARPSELLTAYPFTNDVYKPDVNKRIEGVAIPKDSPAMYVTGKVFDPRVFPDSRMTLVMEELLTQIRLLHGSCNANAMMSPAVHIALNRLGFTDTMFAAMDKTATSNLVPKSTTGRILPEVLRGAWADNRFFSYSNKNAYLPNLGAPDRTIIPDIFRDGPYGDSTTNFVNPTFPEWFRPIHFAGLAPVGSYANAGFIIQGTSDRIWMKSLRERTPVFTFSDVSSIGIDGNGMVRYNTSAYWNGSSGTPPMEVYGSRLDSFSRAAYGDPDGHVRRLRDWYYQYKTKDDVRMADAVTDFATIVQLARFLYDMPPHVLLHSVMGYHNALMKLSFAFTGVPWSTSLNEYQSMMRRERAAIAEFSNGLQVAGDISEVGYALTVASPDLVVMGDADLKAATVASLQLAIATCAANPIAGVVCLALVGIGVLVAELTGGRTQALIIPRDKSREDIRDSGTAGIRCNWFRGYTPEYVVNASPVLRVS